MGWGGGGERERERERVRARVCVPLLTVSLLGAAWQAPDRPRVFPVQSERYPLLSAKGAFCPSCVYTRDHLADVVAYGALRGVRIM